MKNTTICKLIKAGIAVVGLLGLAVCLYWFPRVAILSATPNFWVDAISTNRAWGALGFFWLCCLPCFYLLYLAWRVADAVGEDSVFTAATARRLMQGAVVLASDCGLFILGNTIMLIFAMYYLGFFLIHLVLAALGLIIALGLYVMAKYLYKATALREENEAII